MKIYTIFLFLLASSFSAFAQKVNLKKADKLYENEGYGKYVEMLGQVEIMDLKRPTLIKMATSYRKIGDTQNAEYLYGTLIEQQDDEPMHHFYYGQALQANGKYIQAQKHYLLYDKEVKKAANGKEVDKRGEIMAAACDRIAQFKAVGDVQITNQSTINEASLDFSPAYYGEGIVFVSTRSDAKEGSLDNWTNDNFMDLYYAEKGEDGLLKTAKPFSSQLNSKFHEGPVSFQADQQKIYFTRNNFNMGRRGKSKDKITKLKIYSARQVGGEWTDVRDLQFNDSEIDVCHPAISADGRVLVFAKRAKDGLGDMDLYAAFRVGNSWTEATNLGPEINTAGNELFPYIHHDGTLFFASDGQPGLGRLDVFMSRTEGEGKETTWMAPLNIGAPFNSQYDDFGLILNQDRTEGYFSSNREGGKGKDDIYRAVMKESFDAISPKPLYTVDVCVYDQSDNTRVEGAVVSIRKADANIANLSEAERAAMGKLEGNNIVLNLTPARQGSDEYRIRLNQLNAPKKDADQTYYTDDEGTFLYNMYAGQEYILEVQKQGYLVAKEYFLMPNDADIEEFCIGLEKRLNPFANNGNGVNEGTANTGSLKDALIGPDGRPLVLGPDGQSLPLNKPYVVGMALNKEYNRPLVGTEVTLLDRCTGEEIKVILDESGSFAFSLECGCDYVVKGKKDKFIGDNKIISLVKEADCNEPIVAELLMTPGFDKLGEPIQIGGQTIVESLKEGDVMELKNVFYDFDDYTIREDAVADLYRLSVLMYQFPSMEVELSSHTDSRGTTEYNQDLSTKRAQAAKEYLIKKGVAASRIKAIGQGESRLRNNCKDNTDCSEYEHQRNRRTEILVTKFDKAEYIKVYYNNNEPTKVDPKGE
ncbi:MAG: OmpA family protein [Aureispira sp.]|nr:OmpA family protein [Aureispira sp.]